MRERVSHRAGQSVQIWLATAPPFDFWYRLDDLLFLGDKEVFSIPTDKVTGFVFCGFDGFGLMDHCVGFDDYVFQNSIPSSLS